MTLASTSLLSGRGEMWYQVTQSGIADSETMRASSLVVGVDFFETMGVDVVAERGFVPAVPRGRGELPALDLC